MRDPTQLEHIRRALHPIERVGRIEPGSSAVLLPLVPTEEGLCCLFERRPPGTSRFSGHLSFPGGRIEATDATPLDAALREAQEEIGFAPDDVEVLGHLDDAIDPLGRNVSCFVGMVEFGSIPERPRSPAEVEEMILVPFDDLLRPHPRKEQPGAALLYRAVDYEARTVPSQERLIQYWKLVGGQGAKEATLWGFTAGLVAIFLNRVHGWKPPRPPRIVGGWQDLRP